MPQAHRLQFLEALEFGRGRSAICATGDRGRIAFRKVEYGGPQLDVPNRKRRFDQQWQLLCE